MRRVLVGTLAVALLLCGSAAASALPTEVDTGELHDKRVATLRLLRQETREAREARRAESEETYVPSYPSGVLSAEQVASYARAAGFPEYHVDDMVAFAYRESRFDPGAVNDSSGACGLWQLYPCPGPEALNPATNAAYAFAKYSDGGLSHWGG